MVRSILSGTTALLIASASALAADGSDSARLQKLEAAVSQLQQENASLKSQIEAGQGPKTDFTSSAAAKIKMSDSITQLKIYGDFKLRYYVNEGVAAGRDAGDTGQKDRLRYRLRLGAEFQLQDNWMFGVQLEPNNLARSAVETLGDNPVFGKATISSGGVISGVTASSSTSLNGATLKGGKLVTTSGQTINAVKSTTTNAVTNVNFGEGVFIGRVYLRYQPTDWLTITGGKLANPFVCTRMVWDQDLNPEGFAEQFKTTIGGGSHGPTGKEMQDSKSVIPAGMTVDLFANFGQFIYNDVGFENSFNSGTGPFTQVPNATDRWMFGWQIGAKANFSKDTYFQIAPSFYNYSGGGTSSAGPFNGDNALVVLDSHANTSLISFNQTGTNDLAIIDVPVEFGWRMFGTKFSIFADFSENLDASTRAAKAGHPDTRQGTAWQIGAAIGDTKKKGDWEIRGWYQRSEEFALDQNIIDDDIFDGRLNMQGWYIQGTYMLTDFASVNLQYSHGSRIDPNLGTPGFGLLGTPAGFPLQSTNLVYVDVTVKF